ncbi:MAG TPA: DUF58 domain-containing protein [Vicinamibacterales bacterium]|nr:DUF58 domain-containing protein [Vicinamibacterales bacterium]
MIARRLAPPAIARTAVDAARFPFGLTPRALAFLAAGLLWIVPAWVDPRALLLVLLWDACVAVLIALDSRRLPLPAALLVTRDWEAPLSLGSSTPVSITVHNNGAVPIHVRAADYVSPRLQRDLVEGTLTVARGGAATMRYTVLPRERGDAVMGVVSLEWRDDWGLIERWGIVPLEQTVRVYPDLGEGRRQAMYLIRSRQVALEKRRARRFGGSREFDSLRDYRPGDERRDVAWRASARRGKLVTKLYQPERSQSVWLIVDAGRLLRARAGQHTLLDATITGALTLAQVALASGDRVGLLAYGRRIQHRLAPARGAGHLRAIAEALATVNADGVEADHAAAAAAFLAAQKRRALVVWLTEVAETAGVPDVIEHTLRIAPAHVVLFAVARQPDIAALAATSPATPSAMYRVMSAQETLARRDALLHGLGRRGAMVLEVSPSDLSSGLVDRYLEVKERGLL